jgi:hypothetical protein
VRELSAQTVVFDIEPLVAYWDSGQEALDRGIALVLSRVTTVPGVQVVCFATNSLRRPSGRIPAGPQLMNRLGRLVRPLLFTRAG